MCACLFGCRCCAHDVPPGEDGGVEAAQGAARRRQVSAQQVRHEGITTTVQVNYVLIRLGVCWVQHDHEESIRNIDCVSEAVAVGHQRQLAVQGDEGHETLGDQGGQDDEGPATHQQVVPSDE